MTTPRMTLARAQAAFLRMYDLARMGHDPKSAPSKISLGSVVGCAFWHAPKRSLERRAFLFAKALQKARARTR